MSQCPCGALRTVKWPTYYLQCPTCKLHVWTMATDKGKSCHFRPVQHDALTSECHDPIACLCTVLHTHAYMR